MNKDYLKLLNNYLKVNNSAMVLIESKSGDEKFIFDNISIDKDNIILSNSEYVEKLHRGYFISDIESALVHVNMRNLVDKTKRCILLTNCEYTILDRNTNQKHHMMLRELIQLRRKLNFNIVFLFKSIENISKYFTINSDLVITEEYTLMDNKMLKL